MVAVAISTAEGLLNGLGTPILFQKIFSQIDFSKNYPLKSILLGAGLIALVFLGKGLFKFSSTLLFVQVVETGLRKVRDVVFDKLSILPLDYFVEKGSSEVLNNLTGDVERTHEALLSLAKSFFSSLLSVFGCLLGLLYFAAQNPKIISSYAILLLIIPCMMGINFFRKKINKSLTASREQFESIIKDSSKSLTGIQEIRSFSLENRQKILFQKATASYKKNRIRLSKYAAAIILLVDTLAMLIVIFLFAYAALSQLGTGTVMGLLFVFLAASNNLRKLAKMVPAIQKTKVHLNKIDHFLTQVPAEKDTGTITLHKPQGALHFQNVSLAYKSGKIQALKNISTTIPARCSCALVGKSGCGKTSFVNLITRFYTPSSGTILLDGTDTTKLKLSHLRELSSIVPQQPTFFEGSILDNIALAQKKANEKTIIEAAKKAEAHLFIQALPQGYHTQIGHALSALSGGQQQRIALARALLKKAPILILDEATSDLDIESEAAIHRTIKNLKKERTIIAITHKLSCLKHFEHILFLQKGQLIEQGSLQELTNKKGAFWKFSQQTQN